MCCRMLEWPRLVRRLRLHWNVECWYYFIAHRFERSTPYTSLQPSLTMPWLVTSNTEMWMVKLHCKTQENQMTRCTFKDKSKTKREREKGCIYTTPCGSLYHATRSCGKLKAARRIIATSSCALCGDVPLSGSLLGVDDRSHHPCEGVSASLRRRRLEKWMKS